MIDPKLLCKAVSRYVKICVKICIKSESRFSDHKSNLDSRRSLPLRDLCDAPGDTETGHSLEELESETENVETAMEEELEAHFL